MRPANSPRPRTLCWSPIRSHRRPLTAEKLRTPWPLQVRLTRPRPMLSGKTQARPTSIRAENPTFVAAKGKDGFPPEEATSPADAAAPVVEREAGVGQDGGERTEALAEEAEEPSDPARSVEPEPVAAAPPAVVVEQPAPSVQAQPLPGAAAEVRSDERTRRSNVTLPLGQIATLLFAVAAVIVALGFVLLVVARRGSPSPAQSAATPPALAASPLPVAPPPPSAPQAAVASASAPPRVVVERIIIPQTSPTGQEAPRPPGRQEEKPRSGAMGGVTAPSTPPVAVPPPYSAPPPPPPQVRSTGPISDPVWTRRRTGAEAAEFYPRRAEEDGTEGMAIVDCLVTDDGRLENCSVVEEHPVGVGFGAATLALAKRFRLRSTSQSGELVGGRRVRIPFRWRLGQ